MIDEIAKQIIEKIKASKNILLNVDTRTDFDALCGSKVLYNFITKLGKKTECIHANKINETFTRFNDFEHIQQNIDISSLSLTDYDLIIFFDSGSKSHISLSPEFKIPDNIFTINIDHHETNELFGNINYVMKYGSCCTVLYQFLKECDYDISKEELELLTMGLLTDTGFFKFTNITPFDLKVASYILESGVNISNIITKLSSYEYIDQIRYKELVYKNTVVNYDKKYAYSTVSLNEINERNINMDKVFVRHSDLIKYIEGVDFVFVISEVNNISKYFEISFRSKNPDVDVCELAKKLGGKGHKNAAGVKIYDKSSLGEVLNLVLSIFSKSI